jgi:hypothetical protein
VIPDSLTQFLVRWLLTPLIFLVVVLFGLGWLLPKAWAGLEWLWWRVWLGDSAMGQSVRTLALKDFRLLIREKEADDGAARPLAVLLAIGSRLVESVRLTRKLRRIAKEKEEHNFETSIRSLNEGWRSGMPPFILIEYMQGIRESARTIHDYRDKIRGTCAVTNIMYLLGDLTEGNKLAQANWKEADRIEPKTECQLKWMASYAYFNSTLFLGEFKKAMELMANHWLPHYARLREDEQRKIITTLSDLMTVNPVLSIPRHMILAAAFDGSPIYEPKYWPSPEEYNRLNSEETNNELVWLTHWYEKSKRMCEEEVISLDFSHAYAGFHLTLMYRLPGKLGQSAREDLGKRAREAFDSIGENSPIVSRYAKWGFYGIYQLVSGDTEEALKSFRRAAEYSAVSGNKFADCIFMCCHAVAAQRLNRHLKPEVDYYLAQANLLAKRLGRAFYWDLCEAASSEIDSLRGKPARAKRLEGRSKIGRAGKRILSIFRRDREDD